MILRPYIVTRHVKGVSDTTYRRWTLKGARRRMKVITDAVCILYAGNPHFGKSLIAMRFSVGITDRRTRTVIERWPW